MAATVSSGIASVLTMSAANRALARQPLNLAGAGGGVSPGGVSVGPVASVTVAGYLQSMLTVTGSERLRKSCSPCLGAEHFALYLPTGSCNW